MARGLRLAYLYYIAVPALPAATAKAFRPLYLFLLNKWYFDELYDCIFVRPAFWLGRFLWKSGDGRIIDGLIDGTAAARARRHAPRRPAADRLRLPLRLRHADRRRAARHLLHVHGRGALMNLASRPSCRSSRSCRWSARVIIAFLNARGKATSASWRCGRRSSPSRSRCSSGSSSTRPTPGFQFVEERAWLGLIKYKLGVDGISMLFVILTTFLMPLCILASWESSRIASRST